MKVSAPISVSPGPDLQFNRYTGPRVGADTKFISKFTSPSKTISEFITINNEVACMIDIATESGIWLLALDIETAGLASLIFDVVELAVAVATNDFCKKADKANVGAIVGSVIGSLVFLTVCIYLCVKKRDNNGSNYRQ